MTGFEQRLERALQPVRGLALASAIYAMFASGLYDALERQPSFDPSAQPEYDAERLDALLRYLRNEGIVDDSLGGYTLTEVGRELAVARPWYTLMVGGYAGTFGAIPASLRAGADAAPRNVATVASGSCGISLHGAIPLTRELLGEIAGNCETILDLGCGTGLYLAELCLADHALRGFGVEPDANACSAASKLIGERGLAGRISIHHGHAFAFLNETDISPDAIIFAFVLHEIHGQSGEDGVLAVLSASAQRFPSAHIVVIEVDWRDDLTEFSSALALAYYNPYYLLHPFTRQRLRSAAEWERLFGDAGLEVLERRAIDADVDSTGLEIGYLLRAVGG